MENPRRLGPVRFIISVGLAAVLLPIIFSTYGIAGEDSLASILAKLIQAIPFGKSMLKIALLPLSDTMSHYDTFSDWLQSQDFSLPHHMAMEAGKLTFSSVILDLSKRIFYDNMEKRRGVLNKVADVVFTTLFVFMCGFLTDWMFQWLDILAVKDIDGIIRDIAVYVYSGLLGIGSIALTIISGIVLIDAILSIIFSCFKMVVTYMGIISVLAYYLQTGSMLLAGAILIIWASLIMLLNDVGTKGRIA